MCQKCSLFEYICGYHHTKIAFLAIALFQIFNYKKNQFPIITEKKSPNIYYVHKLGGHKSHISVNLASCCLVRNLFFYLF